MLVSWLAKARKLNIHNVTYFSTCKKHIIDVGINNSTGVATVTMQNLPINILTFDFLQHANTTMDDLIACKTRAIVFKSGIQNKFCAGLDLKELFQPEVSRLQNYFRLMMDFFEKIYGCGMPTAVVINGHAPAAACVIALACQYRVMVNDKYLIGLNEAKLGLTITCGIANMMKEVISPKQTKFAVTSGKLFTAKEALKMGLIDEISEDQPDGLHKAELFIKQFEKIDKAVGMDIRRTIQSSLLKHMQDTKDIDVQQLTAFTMNDRTQKILFSLMNKVK